MTSPVGNKPRALPTPQAAVVKQPEAQPTAIEDHIAFFKSLSKDGVVDAESTRRGLKAIGLTPVSTALGGNILTSPFAIAQAKGQGFFAELKAGATGALAINRLGESIRGPDPKTGKSQDSEVFDKQTGQLNPDAFMTMWTTFAGSKGYLTDEDIHHLVQGKPVNALEFGLLQEVAGQINDKGERVLTGDRVLAFYDGSLFSGLAKARADNVLYKPTGELKHDGAKEIAKRLASMALQNGGVSAGESGKAIFGAKLAIDVGASLTYQQKEKTLWPTIELGVKTAIKGGPTFKGDDAQLAKNIGPNVAGTYKAMCPLGLG
jgi:hypothetical protein